MYWLLEALKRRRRESVREAFMDRVLKKLFVSRCAHDQMTSHLSYVDGRLVHVQDECRECGWRSPCWNKPGQAVNHYLGHS